MVSRYVGQVCGSTQQKPAVPDGDRRGSGKRKWGMLRPPRLSASTAYVIGGHVPVIQPGRTQ